MEAKVYETRRTIIIDGVPVERVISRSTYIPKGPENRKPRKKQEITKGEVIELVKGIDDKEKLKRVRDAIMNINETS